MCFVSLLPPSNISYLNSQDLISQLYFPLCIYLFHNKSINTLKCKLDPASTLPKTFRTAFQEVKIKDRNFSYYSESHMIGPWAFRPASSEHHLTNWALATHFQFLMYVWGHYLSRLISLRPLYAFPLASLHSKVRLTITFLWLFPTFSSISSPGSQPCLLIQCTNL